MNLRNEELFAQIAKQKMIKENQILLMKHRIQKLYFENKIKTIDEYYDFLKYCKNTFEIQDIQNDKGFNYLKKKYLTKFGHLRDNKTIKFKYETLSIIQQMSRCNTKFYFCGFAIISNGVMKFVEPIYKLETYIYGGKKSFSYFHFIDTDYEFNYGLINQYLKDNDILYLEGCI